MQSVVPAPTPALLIYSDGLYPAGMLLRCGSQLALSRGMTPHLVTVLPRAQALSPLPPEADQLLRSASSLHSETTIIYTDDPAASICNLAIRHGAIALLLRESANTPVFLHRVQERLPHLEVIPLTKPSPAHSNRTTIEEE